MSYNSLFGLGSHSPDANLEGWWPCMDSAASTTVLDYSGKGRNGTFQGANTSARAATGPNGWLTSVLDLNGSTDYITFASQNFTSALSVGATVYPDAVSAANLGIFGKYVGTTALRSWLLAFTPAGKALVALSSSGSYQAGNDTTGATTLTASWRDVGFAYDASQSTVIYVDGVSDATNATRPASLYSSSQDQWAGMQFQAVPVNAFNGRIGHLWAFSRYLSAAEFVQIDAGPEPVNSAAPTLSGTQTEGQVLTCASGTWGLPSPFASGSNGTITYTRQWTRSNDGAGSGEADISGATSSTYTLQAGDVGKYIRCRVRASNDGGYDAAADTSSAFTGAIAGAGGGGNRRRRVLLCGSAA